MAFRHFLIVLIMSLVELIIQTAGDTFNVITVAGDGSSSYADGLGSAAKFNNMIGIVVDTNGIVYIADTDNHRIRKILPDGQTSTVAGSLSGNLDGQGTNARLSYPYDLTVDPSSGSLYVTDGGNRIIRRITSSGVVSTLAGDGSSASVDGQGNLAAFANPQGIAFDKVNNVLYVSDSAANQIRKVTLTGLVSTFAGSLVGDSGSTNAQGNSAKFNNPVGLAVNSIGSVFVADFNNNRIRMILSDGTVSTLAGSSYGFANGQGVAAKFHLPQGVAVDSRNYVYVSDLFSNRIRLISPTGYVSVAAGSGCYGCATPYSDGEGTFASFNSLRGITIDANDDLFVVDNGNGRIRKIVTCLSGMLFDPTRNVCTDPQCPPGFQFLDYICQACPIGYYKNATGDYPCAPCLIGTESNVNKTLCVTCPAAKYRPYLVYTSCINCPADFVCTSTQASCSLGYELSNPTTCQLCAAGKYKATVGNETCPYCPIGTDSSANRTFCNTCLAGKYRSKTSYATCVDCPLNSLCVVTGFTCNAGYTMNPAEDACDICATGYYKAASGNQQCTQCPAGTESTLSRTLCSSCPVGKYRSPTSPNICLSCPLNSQCDALNFACLAGFTLNADSNGCEKCPISYAKSVVGNGTCTMCPAGKESNTNRTQCVDCQSGKYRPEDSYPSCIKCPDGGSCTTTLFTPAAGTGGAIAFLTIGSAEVPMWIVSIIAFVVGSAVTVACCYRKRKTVRRKINPEAKLNAAGQ